MQMYSHIPPDAHPCLHSMHHSNKALYPAILSAAAKVPLAASLLTDNPVTCVFWSANGQFIIVQFKDAVLDELYHLYAGLFQFLWL